MDPNCAEADERLPPNRPMVSDAPAPAGLLVLSDPPATGTLLGVGGGRLGRGVGLYLDGHGLGVQVGRDLGGFE